MFETAKDAYARFVDARGEARKVAREEFVDNDLVTQADTPKLVVRLRGERGNAPTERRKHVRAVRHFYTR